MKNTNINTTIFARTTTFPMMAMEKYNRKSRLTFTFTPFYATLATRYSTSPANRKFLIKFSDMSFIKKVLIGDIFYSIYNTT